MPGLESFVRTSPEGPKRLFEQRPEAGGLLAR